MKYPDTRIDDTIDTLSGVAFPDPYRWLERDTHEVRQWQRAQAQLASAHVREWPHYEVVRELVAKFSTERFVTLPRYAAGRWFRAHIAESASQAHVLVADEPFGEGTAIFDPTTENPESPPFLSWISPSPDGRTLAVGLCTDGSESNTIRLIDVATGRLLPDPPSQTLMDNWTGGVQWLPDSSGFFFTALTGTAIEFSQAVYLHRRTSVPNTTQVEIPWRHAKEWRMVVVSADGRYVVAIERLRNPIPVAIASLERSPLRWRSYVTLPEATVAGQVVGNDFIAVTDVGAPRGRLVAIPLGTPDPNDPAHWQERVAESAVTLRTVIPVGETLYLSEFVDTYSRIRMVDRMGRPLGEVPLPQRGAVSELPFPLMNLVPRGHPGHFLFGFSSLTVSPAIYRHVPGEAGITLLKAPQARLEQARVEDRWAVSRDKTRIPYHVVRRMDATAAEAQPTLIYAYGGWNVPLLPQFPGPMAAFVAAGGVSVHAHLRGGGEFGREWWHSGRLRQKQNGYDDLYAIAEDLIVAGICTPQTLALVGGSNGGLLAGVALTQRPELWKVVVPRVPILDLIGSCREPYGRMSAEMEYAEVEDPEEVRRLARFSPYQQVREGVKYPAVYIDAGDTDPRCPPWHARKFAARLQQATTGNSPILLHVWENVGHGGATAKHTAVAEHTEWLAFTLRHLGVQIGSR